MAPPRLLLFLQKSSLEKTEESIASCLKLALNEHLQMVRKFTVFSLASFYEADTLAPSLSPRAA